MVFTMKKGNLAYEAVMNIIMTGIFTLTIVVSIYFFTSLAYKDNFDTEGNEAFSKLTCVFYGDSILFESQERNNPPFVINYNTYNEISKGMGEKYDKLTANCEFNDEKMATFAFKLSLEASRDYKEYLDEILDKEIFINKFAYDYYLKLVKSKRNILKNKDPDRGSGGAVLISRDYNVIIEKDGKKYPALLKVDLIMPKS